MAVPFCSRRSDLCRWADSVRRQCLFLVFAFALDRIVRSGVRDVLEIHLQFEKIHIRIDLILLLHPMIIGPRLRRVVHQIPQRLDRRVGLVIVLLEIGLLALLIDQLPVDVIGSEAPFTATLTLSSRRCPRLLRQIGALALIFGDEIIEIALINRSRTPVEVEAGW